MNYILSFFLVSLIHFASIETLTAQSSNCKSKELKNAATEELGSYYYSSSKIIPIEYTSQSQTKEIELPLLKGEKYKFIFNTSFLPKDVDVEIFDKPKNKNNRKLVFSNNGLSEKIFTFEPEKSKNLYLHYTIPPLHSKEVSTCIAFVMGYQLDF